MGDFVNEAPDGGNSEANKKKDVGLFLKNGSKVLPPRRQQLPVSNSDIEVADSETGGVEQNQY